MAAVVQLAYVMEWKLRLRGPGSQLHPEHATSPEEAVPQKRLLPPRRVVPRQRALMRSAESPKSWVQGVFARSTFC